MPTTTIKARTPAEIEHQQACWQLTEFEQQVNELVADVNEKTLGHWSGGEMEIERCSKWTKDAIALWKKAGRRFEEAGWTVLFRVQMSCRETCGSGGFPGQEHLFVERATHEMSLGAWKMIEDTDDLLSPTIRAAQKTRSWLWLEKEQIEVLAKNNKRINNEDTTHASRIKPFVSIVLRARK